MQVLDLARDSLNPELELLGVCLNIANMRTRHARQTLEALQERFGDKLFRDRDPPVDRLCGVRRAGGPDPRLPARPGADYLSLAGEILRRLGRQDLLEPLDELSAELAAGAGAASVRTEHDERRPTRADGARGDDRRATTRPGTRTISTRSSRCTRRTWCSRTTPPASAPRARRCASTSARSSRPGPTSASTTRRLYVRDGLVVQEWTATRPTPTRCAAATSSPSRPARRSTWDGLDVIPFEDGLVKRKDVYSDSVSILRQLGLAAT